MSADWMRLLESHDWGLFYVHIDERGDSVTLGFERGEGGDGFEFFVVFTGVDGLRVTGWGAAEAKEVQVSVLDGGVFDVLLGSRGSGIVFRAPAARLGKSRSSAAGGA
ncbi:Imm50 family immunity protein [Streptomyces sp. NPDC054794]